MSSEQGETGFTSTQKENDDLSLPFWIFLWSFLAIFAGFIYSKLNRQRDVESVVKSDVQHTMNDHEQIARKLVNEISKKDSGRKLTFRRQRSYEIIDGEVRIHYDVALLEDSQHKRAKYNEGILKSSEVENIPIRSTSLDDLELVYPGNLPRIIEEGEEELLESQSDEQAPLGSVYVNEGSPEVNKCLQESKGKETQVNTTKISNQFNSKENTSNFEANGLHSEGKRDDFIATNFETITQETLIPAESINDASKITINPQKDNCAESNHQGETDLKEMKNEMNLNENSSSSDELSSTSGESVIVNLSDSLTRSTNSLHNSNTTSTSVYKLTQVEKLEGHKFNVTRREVTKLKSNKEYLVESDSFKDETSFPFVETESSLQTALNGVSSSQLSMDVQSDSSISQPDMQITGSGFNSDKNVEFLDALFLQKETINEKLDSKVVAAIEVENFELHQAYDNDYYSNEQLERQELDIRNFQQESPKHVNECPNSSLDPNEDTVCELSNEDVNEFPDTLLQEPCVLTCLEEGSDILVDNSGDILFKIIGPSVEDQYLDDIAENDEVICEKNSAGEFVLDENENYKKFGVKNELAKNWRSLPSWEGVHIIKHCELDRDNSEIDYVDDTNSTVDDAETGLENLPDIKLDYAEIGVKNSVDVNNSIEVKNNDLKQVVYRGSDSEIFADNFDSKYSDIPKSSDTEDDHSPMQNANELVFNEDINEAHLLTLDSKIGSRKTIFVKDSTEPPVYAKNDEHKQSFNTETSFDDSNDHTDMRGVEEVALFGGVQNENTKPDTLECEISDEVEMNEVEARCPAPGQVDASKNAEVFARAGLIEEDVLVAKIITMQDPELHVKDVDLPSSDKSEIVLKNSEADTNESTGQNFMTNSEEEIKLVTVANIYAQPDFTEQNCVAYTNVDVPITEDGLAKASIHEENVLVAKIITVKESERDIDLSCSEQTEDNHATVLSSGQNCMTTSEAEIKTVTIENIYTPPKQDCTAYSNTDAPTTQDSLVHSDITYGEFKPTSTAKTPTTTTKTNTTHTVTKVTHTKVYSIVKKFEEARKPGTENNCKDLNYDIHEPTVGKQSYENSSYSKVEVESQLGESSVKYNLDSDFFQKNEAKDPEVLDNGQISEQTSVSPVAGEREEVRLSDLNTDINCVVDDRPFSEQASVPGEAHPIGELKPHSDECTSSKHQPNELGLKSDAEAKNFGELVEENPEDLAIYANQVTELEASTCDNFGEEYEIDHTSEPIHSRPIDDIVMPGHLTEVSKADEGIIYANQICESEEIADTLIADNYSNKPNDSSDNTSGKNSKDDCSTTVVYAGQIYESEKIEDTYCGAENQPKQTADSSLTQSDKENSNTTVIYINQFNETEETPQKVVENTSPADTKNISPNNITEEDQNSQIDLANPSPISPQLNNESRSFRETSFDSPPLTSSPVRNESPRETQEDITSFDKHPSTSSPVPGKTSPDIQEGEIPSVSSPVPNKTPSELWPNVPRGETDVQDSFSDIDEIDIDVLPEENYQKSKSVTDLDEALASFGRLDYLSNDALDQDNVSGGLSKSVPDILDSCREESLRETVANPENLEKKTLSLSTPEITSKTKPGSKKVTKIKIIHVKFLEMQDDGESVEEDSFIYEGVLPITGKMKRRSRNLSDELSSPVASPPPDVSSEIAQERWIAEKTSLKQLEFEFGDLFQNSPSSPPPPPLEPNESSIDGPNQASNTDTREDISKFQNASMVLSVPENNSCCETAGQVSNTSDSPNSTSQDSTIADSSVQRPSSTETNNKTFGGITANTPSTTNSSKFENKDQRVASTQSSSSTITYHKTSTTVSYSSISTDTTLKLDIEESSKDIISALPIVTKATLSTETPHQTSNIFRSSTNTSSETNSKVEYQNVTLGIPSVTLITSESETPHETSRIIRSSMSGGTNSRVEYQNIKDSPSPISSDGASQTSTDSRSYRYTPGNSHSYSKVPKPVPEHAKYVVKSGMIATQSTPKQNTRNITTQASYNESNNSPKHVTTQTQYSESPNSPRRVTQCTENPNSSRHIATQVRYTNSPNSSSPTSSPRHGMKLSEKFRMSEETDLGQKPRLVPSYQTDGSRLASNPADGQVVPNNLTDGTKTKRSNHRGSNSKPTSRRGGRLVTVKGGIISDYECSSDADSEMSYNVPSPRVKAKRYHRPQVHRVDSASSSEPDSPRRGTVKDERRSMSELFGVDEASQYSSDASKNGGGRGGVGRDSGSQSSLRDQKLFSRFGNLGQSDEKVTRHNETFVEMNPSPSNVYQARTTAYDQRRQDAKSSNPHYTNTLERNPSPPYQTKTTTLNQKSTEPEARTYHPPRYTSALERNLSPTSFLQEGNLGSDDQTSPKTIEFNPFEDLEGRDGLQPFERCHSPSSVYSDTSSVFSFNCDFDPMPPPAGEFEPEVYMCENPMCRKQDILLGPEKTNFKSCPACFTYYCSSECRKLHWPSHKQGCYFGRVNTYVRSIIRLCQRREDLSMYLSQLARDGYKKKGRGVVMAIFNSPELAREFITKGHDAFSGRKPTYSSLAELNREGIISKHRVALMQAVRDYEPNEEFVFNIAVVATNNIPIAPAPRYKLNTVLHCIKMPLNDLIVAREPKDYEKVETRLFALPKCSRHEFVNDMEARRHYCRNLSKNLRQYNIKLKEDYPECYRRLCMYVEHNISFERMTVYGQRSGFSYKCVIAPEQNYPLNAEYC